jgi:hypothetical protein
VDIKYQNAIRARVSAIEENEFDRDEAQETIMPRKITRRRFVAGTVAGGVGLRGSLP